MSINTLGKSFRLPAFFTLENVKHISNLITETIRQNFSNPDSTIKKVIVSDAHIFRVMQTVQEEYIEPIPRLNQRVIMYIVDDFINFVRNQEKNNYFAANYRSTIMYQNAGIQNFDLGSQIRGKKVGKDTSCPGFRFFFTY